MSNDDMVLVWHKNRGRDGKAIIHAHADCSTIVNRNPPRRSILYGGRGTAGWLPRGEARVLRKDGRRMPNRACEVGGGATRRTTAQLPSGRLSCPV